MPAENQQELLHEEANEVLGRTPIWLVRWGNTILLSIVVALLGVSAIVYYPDTITGKATILLTGSELVGSPAHETKVAAVFVKDGSSVIKGQAICVLQATDEPAQRDTVFAPAPGVVRFQRLIEASFVLPSSAGLAVIADPSQQHRVLIETSSFKAGKIRIGQTVRITAVKYPQQEFGELEAKIISLPSDEQKGMVMMEAALVKGTTTNQGNTLQLDLASSGMATIVTDKRTVFKRLFWFL